MGLLRGSGSRISSVQKNGAADIFLEMVTQPRFFLWRKGLDKTFSNGRQYARAVEERWTRKYALDIVKTVHALRNRVAHHEPLVNGIPLPGENRRIALENATQACFALAMILDRDLHAWLMDNSKMKLVLEHELKPNE